MSVIAVIPARGGSRRIPQKNRRLFHGMPIIAHSIGTAQKSGLFTRIIVSTDDGGIADIARSLRAEVVTRTQRMCEDDIGPHDVTASVLEYMTCDIMTDFACCIYATAPMMTVSDLARCWYALCKSDAFDYAITVAADPAPLTDAAHCIFGRVSAFLHHAPLWTPRTALVPVDNNRVCDINVEEDWARAEAMYARMHDWPAYMTNKAS